MEDFKRFVTPSMSLQQLRVANPDAGKFLDEVIDSFVQWTIERLRRDGHGQTPEFVRHTLEEFYDSGLIRPYFVDVDDGAGMCCYFLVWNPIAREYRFAGGGPPTELKGRVFSIENLPFAFHDDEGEGWKRGKPDEWRPGT